MRALVGLLMVTTALATTVAAQTTTPVQPGKDGVAEAAKPAGPETKGKRVQGPAKGKRTKTTIPPRKGKKG